MRLLLAYSWRNVFTRRLTSALTIFGVALVVFVFCAVLMLSHGLRRTLVDTGDDNNAVVIRKAAQTEITSIVYRREGNIIKADPAVALTPEGRPRASGELLVLITKTKRSSDETSNVPVRGVAPEALLLRPDISLVAGRLWRPGRSEIIAGAKVAAGFQNAGLGEKVRFASRDWTVVGIFEDNNSGFESELWGDYDQLAAAFERPIYSSVTVRLKSPDRFSGMKARLENDPRLAVDVRREKQYYADQSSFTATYINILGLVISVIFSVGAIVGAMITMYGSVAGRTREIGTLRTLGFGRFAILSAFLAESVLMALVGGGLGVTAAALLRFAQVSTTNWDTFAELAFSFETSPGIIAGALVFAALMGVVGGFLPAVRASRLSVLSALRAK
ncbi:MAG TPA: ABC transporter permease [candidate division Zixibacteria bacterium]|nr:ABC transporter permease [candidate division Zixibacteria bacterium]MDD4918088.1 ABC transporter permease [candidate division Zixibacteria bacterium]MDM7972043.1 ABC transporter permease [candidate division Zixibacteria bacterium]HOD66826.1 ABC transporter permease [candidate division Zixibacteria bacterium]HPI32205.1 ABC transporter permease [candidate division Zixibacteria bacterium]